MSYSNELYHHGILGQKWGIRRYRNPDGTLTTAGKKRYAALTRKDGSTDYAKRTYGARDKRFKKTHEFWLKADKDAYEKDVELNKSELGKKFGNYVNSGVISRGPSGKVRAFGKDPEETLDAIETYTAYGEMARKIAADAFDTNVDYILTENGYKVTEEGRKYAKEWLSENMLYQLTDSIDPIVNYNVTEKYRQKAEKE